MEQIPVHKYGILTSRAADVQKLSTSAFSGLFSFWFSLILATLNAFCH